METLGDKTPVSCLQEYLVSKKMIPTYELIFNGVGTHLPKFVFRVQVGALWEDGTGRSKREAKHRAAEKMLKTLKVVDIEDNIEEIDLNESMQEVAENYVGQLKDLCVLHRYPEPKYYLEEAAGPSHSRVFKMICCVSQLQDFGISKTKKQAKQQAAFKMLQRLKEVGSKRGEDSIIVPESPSKGLTKPVLSSVTDKEVIEKYIALKPNNVPAAEDPAVYYKDHYKAFLNLHETSLTLSKLISETNIIESESSLSFINEIAKELEVNVNVTEISTKKKGENHIVMAMTVFPPIAAVGFNKENAAFNLLNSLLFLCRK